MTLSTQTSNVIYLAPRKKTESIVLKHRQKELVEHTLKKLQKSKSTLAVAPTGAGKTLMMSAIIHGYLQENPGKAIVFQHRHELLTQNKSKFESMFPHIKTSVVNAEGKDWSGDVIFAMVPSVHRTYAFPKFTIAAFDEAHHAAARTWKKVIRGIKKSNPDIRIFGVTATPNRGDKKGLKSAFSSVSDQITLRELIAEEHLVKPRTFVVDLGCQDELKGLYGRGPQADRIKKLKESQSIISEAQIQEEAAKILDTSSHRKEVFRNWKNYAGNLKTVIFCTTVDHAKHVAETFQRNGVKATYTHGKMSMNERTARLQSFESGKEQVIVNVMILTEGWDCPAVECVVLLRPSSYKSTMIQMVGRGLRPYPGKLECKILDFGMSSVIHGSLEQDIGLESEKKKQLMKECPSCNTSIPRNKKECPECGHEFKKRLRKPIQQDNAPPIELGLKEIRMIEDSPFRWVYLEKEEVLVASSVQAFVMIKHVKKSIFRLYGNLRNEPLSHIGDGPRCDCLYYGDKFLRKHTQGSWSHKDAGWLKDPPTDKQIRFLMPFNVTPKDKYEASAFISYHINKSYIPELRV